MRKLSNIDYTLVMNIVVKEEECSFKDNIKKKYKFYIWLFLKI